MNHCCHDRMHSSRSSLWILYSLCSLSAPQWHSENLPNISWDIASSRTQWCHALCRQQPSWSWRASYNTSNQLVVYSRHLTWWYTWIAGVSLPLKLSHRSQYRIYDDMPQLQKTPDGIIRRWGVSARPSICRNTIVLPPPPGWDAVEKIWNGRSLWLDRQGTPPQHDNSMHIDGSY